MLNFKLTLPGQMHRKFMKIVLAGLENGGGGVYPFQRSNIFMPFFEKNHKGVKRRYWRILR